MPIQEWSDRILVVELGDEPQFSEDVTALMQRLHHGPAMDVVISLGTLEHVNSSNVTQLLRVRTHTIRSERHLRLCNVPNSVWGVMLVTGLDKIFDMAPDVMTALAELQLAK